MANTLNIQLKISKMHMHRINWCRIAMACSTLEPIPQFDHSTHKSWLEVTPHQHNVHKCTESLIDFVMDPSTQQVLFPRPNRGYKSWPKSHYRGNRVPQLLQHRMSVSCLSMLLSTDVTELHKMVNTQLNYRACRARRSRYWGRELKLNTGLSGPWGRERGSEGERERLKGKDFVRTS